MIVHAKLVGYEDDVIFFQLDNPIGADLLRLRAETAEIRINDGRTISADQRKKIFAIIRDIAQWCGHFPEEIRQHMTWSFVSETGGEMFSLSDVEMETATLFIEYLIRFCFSWNVPTKKPMMEYADDIDRYLYLCLKHRKCAICQKPAHVHHVDTVGMGNNRNRINHVGKLAVALCADHHKEAHEDWERLSEQNHIYGIPLTARLIESLRISAKKRIVETGMEETIDERPQQL